MPIQSLIFMRTSQIVQVKNLFVQALFIRQTIYPTNYSLSSTSPILSSFSSFPSIQSQSMSSRPARVCISPKLPDEEPDMIPVEEYAGLALVIEEGSEVDAGDHMPAALELLLEALLDVLGRVLQVGDLVLDHLHVDVLRDLQGVLLHLHAHVAELYICRDLHAGRDPVFGDACARLFFLLDLFFHLLLLGRHKRQLKLCVQMFRKGLVVISIISIIQMRVGNVWFYDWERVWDDGMVCSVAVIYDRYSQCMKPHRLHRNQFVSLGDITLQQLATLGPSRKQSSTFVTQKTIVFEDEIRQHHYELNRYLDRLDEKVAGVIQHNQAEIFTAFKSHFARVKKDLEEFKKHSEAQANSSNTFLEKIEALEKQLAVFRDESLKLFSKLTEREKTIEHMRMNMEELQSEKRHMDSVVKELSKRNRELQSQKEKYEERKNSETDNMALQINSFTKNFMAKNRLRERSAMQPIRPASNMSMSKRSANNTISVDQTFHQFTESDAIGKYLKERLPSLDEKTLQRVREVVAEYISEEERKRARQARSAHFQKDKERYDKNQTRMTNRSRSICTADPDPTKRSIEYNSNDRNKQSFKYKSQQFTNTLQLSKYFKKCIEIVRKEIGMRRKVNSVSFYREGAPIGIDEFKKIDFIRLMELVCSHEPIILALYGMLVDSAK